MDKNITFTKDELGNIITFLDRVTIKGLKEITALNAILTKLLPSEKIEE